MIDVRHSPTRGDSVDIELNGIRMTLVRADAKELAVAICEHFEDLKPGYTRDDEVENLQSAVRRIKSETERMDASLRRWSDA